MTEHIPPGQDPLPEPVAPAATPSHPAPNHPPPSHPVPAGDEAGQSAPLQQAPKRRSTALIWAVVVGIVMLVAAIAAIIIFSLRSDQPAPTEPPPAPEVSETTTPEPSAEPAPAAIVIDDCATLNPLAQGYNDEFIATADVAQHGEIGTEHFSEIFGPAAQATLALAAETRGCLYIFSYHDGLNQFVSEVAEADQAALRSAVEDDADFVEASYRGATYFSWADQITDGPMTGTNYTVHAFIGDVWIAMSSYGDPAVLLPPVVDAVIDANSQLEG